MTPQSAFMIVATVRDGAVDDLRELLSGMSGFPAFVDPDSALIPFGAFDRLHTARLVIIESHTLDEIRAFGVTPRPWRPALAFMGDIDGDVDAFLIELVERAGPGLGQVFSHCEGFPSGECDLAAWLKAHNIKPTVNYVNYLGRTVTQVREEAALHVSLAAHLRDIASETDGIDNWQLRQRLLTHVEWEKHNGKLQLTPPAPTPFKWQVRNLLHKFGLPLILLLALPLLLLSTPLFLVRLRRLERSDPELFIRPDRAHVMALSAQEDHDVSNQYNVFGDLKPGWFRRWVFQFTHLLIDYFARHLYYRGFLSRIRTIHFARWVIMDDRHRVFFASTYDGSHESYMDDFINKVGWGLNLSFSHGVGYPTTSWLIKQGANRELPFKYTQRRHQLRSEVWYKAYPGLTAVDLHRNSRIREGVEVRPSSPDALREWLSLI
ncbi:MAG: hypothetical protein WBM97_00720 [Sedimenticolaceae bacterium]